MGAGRRVGLGTLIQALHTEHVYRVPVPHKKEGTLGRFWQKTGLRGCDGGTDISCEGVVE